MTKCAFYVLSAEYDQLLGFKDFDSFAAARAFLRSILDNNLDAIETFNGYVAMACQIYN